MLTNLTGLFPIRALINIAVTIGIIVILNGCDQPKVIEQAAQTSSSAIHDRALASTNTQPIHQSDLPLADQIKLYNLNYQVHQLTSASLRETIERKHPEAETVQWQLPPPIAPTTEVELLPDWTMGNETSPWQISLFCTLQSRPCSDLLMELSKLAEHTRQGMYIKYYHFWHGFHKHAVNIASASHCMQASAKPTFLDALKIKQGQIDMAVLSAAIDLYSPEPDQVYTCMQKDQTHSYLNKRYDQIKQLGIRKAPTAFINKTYLARGYELSQIFVNIKDDLKMETAALNQNLEWLQSWQTQSNQDSTNVDWALAKTRESVMRISVGSRISDAFVASITQQGFGLYKDGKVEFIGQPETSRNQLYGNSASNSDDQNSLNNVAASNLPKSADDANTSSSERFIPEDAKARYEAVIAELPKQPLPQNWLEQQLMRQSELEQDFHLTEGKFEDKSLVKLDAENIDSFYQTLGMHPGDVIMRVNDDWVHEQSNTLFQTLANEEQVTISVMRKGKPVHFAFQVTQ